MVVDGVKSERAPLESVPIPELVVRIHSCQSRNRTGDQFDKDTSCLRHHLQADAKRTRTYYLGPSSIDHIM